MRTKEEIDFVNSLMILAQECNREITKGLIERYVVKAHEAGIKEATGVVNFILENRRSRDPFPTPREIIDKMNQANGIIARP